jgi:hypothetical protein
MATIPQFESRPEVEVVVYRHRPGCKFTAPDKLGRCSCRKHLYVREARLRIATGKKSWEAAREFAAQWQDANDPAKIKRREQAAKEQASLKLIEDAFDDFIAAKKSASDNPDGFVATESKFRTLKKQLLIFLAKSNNGLHETERVHYVHQITSLLLDKWMATWKAKTYWSKTKRRDNCIAFFEHCIDKKWIAYDATAKDKGNPARGMMRITTAKGSTIPTLPFTPAQFGAGPRTRYKTRCHGKQGSSKKVSSALEDDALEWLVYRCGHLGAPLADVGWVDRTKTSLICCCDPIAGPTFPHGPDGILITSSGVAGERRTRPPPLGRRRSGNCGSSSRRRSCSKIVTARDSPPSLTCFAILLRLNC